MTTEQRRVLGALHRWTRRDAAGEGAMVCDLRPLLPLKEGVVRVLLAQLVERRYATRRNGPHGVSRYVPTHGGFVALRRARRRRR